MEPVPKSPPGVSPDGTAALVQILVVVAIIQMRFSPSDRMLSLKTEVEKGSM